MDTPPTATISFEPPKVMLPRPRVALQFRKISVTAYNSLVAADMITEANDFTEAANTAYKSLITGLPVEGEEKQQKPKVKKEKKKTKRSIGVKKEEEEEEEEQAVAPPVEKRVKVQDTDFECPGEIWVSGPCSQKEETRHLKQGAMWNKKRIYLCKTCKLALNRYRKKLKKEEKKQDE